ncbi:sorting nexin-10A isoform X1 [Scleropages formosus]|nr:sorting nexin-10A-like isoform X1 [Scleropages formosus]XP_029104281.1 sorting nexin-10A-like isoform X1 [Scleropages formosus]
MEDIRNLAKKEFVSVWVRDPRIQKRDFWHAYIDYEICLHTNSMCFRKKISCVRRRYREFVWLRQKLQNNALLIELPKLPPRNPFFSQTNNFHVDDRMYKLQHFLEAVLQIPLVLSDSHLHLFLQSNLSISKMEACAAGLTHYTVAQAIQRNVSETQRFPSEEELHEEDKACSDSDSDSTSALGSSSDPGTPPEDELRLGDGSSSSCDCQNVQEQEELLSCLSSLPCDEKEG